MTKEINIAIVPKCKEILFQRARYKVLRGGRGAGKSYAVAKYLIVRSLQGQKRILCTREIQNSIKDSVYRLLVDLIKELSLENNFDILKDTIVSSTGSEFIFKGLHRNISEIKSMEGIDICWVEEAEVVPEESWKVLIPTIREEGSEIIVTFNPENEKSATYQRFVTNPPPDCISCEVNYYDNDAFPEVLRKEMEYDKRTDPEKYEHIWLGKVKKYAEAVIFKNKIQVEEFDEPEFGTQLFYGADWGYSVDPTCLLRMFVKNNKLYISHEFYAVGVEIGELEDAFDTVPDSREWKITADSARPETISHLSRCGFNIVGAEKGKGSVEDGIEFLRSFEAIVIHPRCKGAIDNFKNYKWKQDKLTGEILPIPVDSSNHAPDAARYALEDYIKAKTGKEVAMVADWDFIGQR